MLLLKTQIIKIFHFFLIGLWILNANNLYLCPLYLLINFMYFFPSSPYHALSSFQTPMIMALSNIPVPIWNCSLSVQGALITEHLSLCPEILTELMPRNLWRQPVRCWPGEDLADSARSARKCLCCCRPAPMEWKEVNSLWCRKFNYSHVGTSIWIVSFRILISILP